MLSGSNRWWEALRISSQHLEKAVVGDSLPHAASRVTTVEPAVLSEGQVAGQVSTLECR